MPTDIKPFPPLLDLGDPARDPVEAFVFAFAVEIAVHLLIHISIDCALDLHSLDTSPGQCWHPELGFVSTVVVRLSDACLSRLLNQRES